MGIIINEFSLTGQFNNINNFYNNLKDILVIIRSINNYKINVLKSTNFSNLQVTQNLFFSDLLNSKDDELRGLKSEISKFIFDPFWESSPKHNCNDSYTCSFTNLTCMYGLAEAVENVKTIISFDHENFNVSEIEINKNGIPFLINNIYDLDSLITFLNNNIDSPLIPYEVNSEVCLPNKKITDSLLKIKNVEASWKGVSPGEQITSYLKWGNIVAKFNFWKLNTVITRFNDRDIFSKKINNKIHYLSIDRENGTFEFFNHNGNHLGEFNFKFERTQNIRTHTINLN
jgi:hypothetical protein